MGGNVFQGSVPIRKEDIKPTLSKFIQELIRIFPGAREDFREIKTLGSTGQKSVSGDIDLALDEKVFRDLDRWGFDEDEVQDLVNMFKKRARTASEAMLLKRAILTLFARRVAEEGKNLAVDDKGTGNGSLFFQFPQFGKQGESLGKRVQIDLNVGNLPWLEFVYHHSVSQQDSTVKGLHRTQLMVSLFANKKYIFSHNYGVKDKETNRIVANTPEKAIKLLNELYGFNITEEILSDYEKLQKFLRKNLDERELDGIYDTYLRILDSTRCDIPSDMQNDWLDRQERLDLSGKFLPSTSKLFPFKSDF